MTRESGMKEKTVNDFLPPHLHIFCGLHDALTVGQAPVVFHAVLAELLPCHGLCHALLEFQLAEVALLDQSLPDDGALVGLGL